MRVSQQIESLVPYKPGKPIAETQREYGLSEVYKLASNENPLGPSPKAMFALRHALENMHRYPDPAGYALIKKLSEVWKCAPEHLALGNGSNEIIDLLIRIYCEPGDSILISKASFIAYEICAQAARVNTFKVEMADGFKVDLNQLAEEFLAHPERRTKLIFIPNPNNPTGSYVGKIELESFLKKLGGRDDVLLVFDEAYNEYVRAEDYRSAQDYQKTYNNIVVIRTFSKVYGLAGLRLGVMIAPTQVNSYYHRVRNPFNVNELAQVAALAAVEDFDFIKKSQQVTWNGLDYFYKELAALKLPFVPSQGNFVMFDTLRNASLINESLLRRGIIMRPILNYGFSTHMRLSVGLEKENQLAIKALSEVIQEIPKLNG
jgi:histidinol-phosphate aminotransferase